MAGRERHGGLLGLVLFSLVLLAVRFVAASRVGFGDSEALYASYALHPQPAYLDHPGLIGVITRLVGGGTSPSPAAAHRWTAAAATAWPWFMAIACRIAGASFRRAFAASLVAALVPEMAIGLFALTPDLLLAFAWTCAIGLAALSLRLKPGSAAATAAFAGAGLSAGVAASAKVTGLALLAALAAGYVSRPARAHARTVAPWAGLAAGLVVIVPIARFESHLGWPMLQHRLVDTQATAGFSLRNAGALLGGQLVYLSPCVVGLAFGIARSLWKPGLDAVSRLLWASVLVPLVPIVVLCLWSPVAEPHWIAPALLGLVPLAARGTWTPSRRLLATTYASSALLVAAVHAWVLIPEATHLWPRDVDRRVDLANELYGWRQVSEAVEDEVRRSVGPTGEGSELSVVGPHWVICAQLEAALRGRWPVGCNTDVPDDFDGWWPRARWQDDDVIVWVSDTRFDRVPETPSYAPLLAAFAPVRTRGVGIYRGERLVRRFTITVLNRRAAA